jgi:hypothetical protein|tara:strand:+ start:1022 stop:1378 length:357 start_codon:yes stop_codon:yes gene_type:complete
MKKNDVSSTQIAVNFKQKWSHNNEEYYYEIEFIDDSNGKLSVTYVSENNRNYRIWEQLITAMEDKPGHGVVLSGDFKLKKGKVTKNGLSIMNADCKDLTFEQYVPKDMFMNFVLNEFY